MRPDPPVRARSAGSAKIESWDAVAWGSGGSVAVILARPDDAALKAKVRDILIGLKVDPANRITDLLEGDAIAKAGGNTQASFYLNLAPPMLATGYIAAAAPLRFVPPTKGMHGFFPADPACVQPSSSPALAFPRAAIWARSTCARLHPLWPK
jgi:hypothetical protein